MPNQPPTIDWALTVPAEDSFTFQRRKQKGMAFDITDAVEDLEGDPLFSAWYWVDSEGDPHFLFGTLSMTFDAPCDLKSFANPPAGSFVSVVAVVSDHELTWAQTADPTQPVQTSMDADGKGPCKNKSIAPRASMRPGQKARGCTPTAGVL